MRGTATKIEMLSRSIVVVIILSTTLVNAADAVSKINCKKVKASMEELEKNSPIKLSSNTDFPPKPILGKVIL